MYYIYLLKSSRGKLYIGYSSDLRKRIQAHLSNQVATTSKMHDIQLVYYEAYSSKQAAQERERKLKQFGSSYNGLIKRLKLK